MMACCRTWMAPLPNHPNVIAEHVCSKADNHPDDCICPCGARVTKRRLHSNTGSGNVRAVPTNEPKGI